MAVRNMEQIANKVHDGGYVPPEYQLCLPEVDRLHDLVHKGLNGEFDALAMAFDYGFAMGCRATKKGRTKNI